MLPSLHRSLRSNSRLAHVNFASNSVSVQSQVQISPDVLSRLKDPSILKPYGMIDGKWDAAGCTGTFEVRNPANGALLAVLPRMGAAQAEYACGVAMKAWKCPMGGKSFKDTTAVERSDLMAKLFKLLEENKEDLATILTLEAGKPLAEAAGEITYGNSFVSYFSEEARRIMGEVLPSPLPHRRLMTIKQPVGPAGLITPWNFPSAMITRKLSPALAAGCSVVIKPACETPLSALAICALVERAGFPAGVVNCLTVHRDEVEATGLALCHSHDLRKISFTGSTNVGKWLMREASTTVKRISLELGGNAPFIVFDDADIDVALSALMSAKFRNAGQVCIASNRIFVQDGIYDAFAARLAEKVGKLRVGDGTHDETNVGPLINKKGLQKVQDHVSDAISKGAKALVGGTAHEKLNTQGGHFFNPTVLTDMTKEMLPYRQETFGPLLPLFRFTTEREVIELANDTEFGLAAYFCTRDLSRAFYVAEALEAGIIGVNEGVVSISYAPFGGYKQSGLGREGGTQGISEFLEEKYICMGLEKRM